MIDLRKNGRPFAAGVIILVAAVLTLPAALGPVRLNDSFWIDWVWLDQFARELGRGTLYPRWLPLSHAGLGSPVFYYYPPLAFYIASPFVLAGLGVYPALIATFFAGYILSGATMYWWLKPNSEKPLVGAVIFMVAPYHTFNFYNRGALAEFMATALLPVIMIGMRRLKMRSYGGFTLTAVSYAALICTHLPLALLTSIFLIGPTLAFKAYKNPLTVVPTIAALAAGVGLAAIYWVPAIWLEPYRDTAKLWADPVLQPSNWSFWDPHFATSPGYIAVAVIAAALALPLTGLVVRQRSRWAMYGLVCVLLAIGTIPALWDLPLLRSVQFPFRLLPLAEFALATAIAGVAWRPAALSVAAAPLLAISGFVMAAAPADQGVSLADVRVRHADVPEDLPPGDRPYSWPSRWALDLAAAHPGPAVEGGPTVEPVFYFPAWEVRCGGKAVRTYPEPSTKLLAHEGRDCVPSLRATKEEKAGAAISLAALIVLAIEALIALRARKRRQRLSAPPPLRPTQL